MEKLYRPTSNIFSKMAVQRRHTPHPTPWIRPIHKLQKLSKESGIFQSLGTINFVFFLLKDRVKRIGPGGGWHNAHPPYFASDSTPSIS